MSEHYSCFYLFIWETEEWIWRFRLVFTSSMRQFIYSGVHNSAESRPRQEKRELLFPTLFRFTSTKKPDKQTLLWNSGETEKSVWKQEKVQTKKKQTARNWERRSCQWLDFTFLPLNVSLFFFLFLFPQWSGSAADLRGFMTFGFINTNEASASCRADIYLRLKDGIAKGAASLTLCCRSILM